MSKIFMLVRTLRTVMKISWIHLIESLSSLPREVQSGLKHAALSKIRRFLVDLGLAKPGTTGKHNIAQPIPEAYSVFDELRREVSKLVQRKADPVDVERFWGYELPKSNIDIGISGKQTRNGTLDRYMQYLLNTTGDTMEDRLSSLVSLLEWVKRH